MQLTPLQLQIQERADKTLSFGCLFRSRGTYVMKLVRTSEIQEKIETGWQTWYSYDIGEEVGGHRKAKKYLGDFRHINGAVCGSLREDDIVGHPMNWGRLCYLLSKLDTVEQSEKRFAGKKLLGELERRLGNNREYYQQTVLERDEKTQELVLAFLNTLGPL